MVIQCFDMLYLVVEVKNPTDWVALTVTAHLMDSNHSMHSCSVPPSLETHGNVSDSMVIQCFGMLYLVVDVKIRLIG